MNSTVQTSLVVLFCFAVGVLVLLGNSIRLVPESRRLVMFRLGRVVRLAGPGLTFVVPFIDRGVMIDLREQLIEMKAVSAVTQDKSPVTLDLACRYKVTDPVRSLTEVGNARVALSQATQTALREVVAGLSLYEFLQDEGEIRSALEARLRPLASPWGVEVVGVEAHNLNRAG
jgi:regulator of protease activity HflC (stomatin/prohibitin superfamily)